MNIINIKRGGSKMNKEIFIPLVETNMLMLKILVAKYNRGLLSKNELKCHTCEKIRFLKNYIDEIDNKSPVNNIIYEVEKAVE
jgi:hypothetical protein